MDLGVLRTAKMAMSEDLICEEDFNSIKKAFLKAQQIKAGMDAGNIGRLQPFCMVNSLLTRPPIGFLREEDYMQARDSFLQSLDFQVHAPPSQLPTTAAQPHSTPASPSLKGRPSSGNTNFSAPPRAPPPPGPPPPPVNVAVPRPAPAPTPAPTSLPGSAASSAGGAASSGALAALHDLPRIGKAGVAEGKKSMSGITVQDQTINVFNHMKTRSAFRWITYKIDDGGHEVVVEAFGTSSSTYGEFVASLPPTQCRYGAIDYAYTNADTGVTLNKLVFINWAPDSASTRTKMMYASTKDFFKAFLDGIGAEVQASEASELSEQDVQQAISRK